MLYFCKLGGNTEDGEAGWQGPYQSVSPRAAASLWIKREWDCRHQEIVEVQVRDEEGRRYAVKMRVRVTLVLEGNSGPLLEAA